MKNLLILLFLIVSAKLKDKENSPELQDLIDDDRLCDQAEYNTESCFPIKLTTKNAQCCLFEHSYYDGSKRSCSVFPSSIKDYSKKIDLKKISTSAKEVIGFRAYILSETSSEEEIEKLIQQMSNKLNYKCKDGELSIIYGYDTYTPSEVNILKSSNHCLRYFYSYALDEDYKSKVTDKDTCFKADLMQSSKDAGIECGYFEFKFKSVDGNDDIYKTCYIFNENILSNNNMDYLSLSIFTDLGLYISMKEKKRYDSYTINMVNSKGTSFIYDSSTQKVIYNKTNMLLLSKYLGLLLIFIL